MHTTCFFAGTVLAIDRQSWRYVCEHTEFHGILFRRYQQRHGVYQIAERNNR